MSDGITLRCLSFVLSPLAVGFSFLPCPLGVLLLEMGPTLSPAMAVQVVRVTGYTPPPRKGRRGLFFSFLVPLSISNLEMGRALDPVPFSHLLCSSRQRCFDLSREAKKQRNGCVQEQQMYKLARTEQYRKQRKHESPHRGEMACGELVSLSICRMKEEREAKTS
ncbi:hypothetical protein BHM03_00060497 [Ensete ventricosum]|nr:hypothetical protein BHM03_00060497 [Ensete ventricosum]